MSRERGVDNFEVEGDCFKNLLLISDKEVCVWLNDKIQSANIYYKELKNVIETVD